MTCKEFIFSPMGGTRKAADIFTAAWDDEVEVIDLSAQAFDGTKVVVKPEDAVLVAMPCFAGRVPEVAVQRLRQVVGSGAPCVVMCVYGNRAFEDGLIEMADAATEAGFVVVAGVAAVAQHSIMPQFATSRPDASDIESLQGFARIVKRLMGQGAEATQNIPGNRPYKKAGAIPLVPSVSESCTECGVCAELCPVGAIDNKTFEADKKRCLSCMRCVEVCPASARSINKVMAKMAAKSIEKTARLRKEAVMFV